MESETCRLRQSCHPRAGMWASMGSMAGGAVNYSFYFFTNHLSDSKRQQTTTVDNKRLINGLVLTDGFSLRHINTYYYGTH